MNLINSLTDELSNEIAITRNHFTRIEAEHMAFKPHEKSMTMGQLTGHCVDSLSWSEDILTKDIFELDLENYKPLIVSSQSELLELTDKNLSIALDILAITAEENLFKPWTMIVGGHAVIKDMPRIDVFRTFILNHIIHHRGQLTVYMRLCDILVPITYGSSADET